MRCLQERIARIILGGTVDIQTRKQARKRIISLVIFKRKTKEGNVE